MLAAHSRASHLLIRTGSPSSTHLQSPLGKTSLPQTPTGKINQLQVPIGQIRNTPPCPGKIRIIPTLHNGLTRLPKTQIGTRNGSAPWG
jgi:hypothetical protein